jgi:hypothetical protein
VLGNGGDGGYGRRICGGGRDFFRHAIFLDRPDEEDAARLIRIPRGGVVARWRNDVDETDSVFLLTKTRAKTRQNRFNEAGIFLTWTTFCRAAHPV